MPVGFAFQAVSIVCWSLVFLPIRGRPAFVGIAGLLAGTALIVVLIMTNLRPPGHVVFGAIAMLIFWHIGAATAALRLPPGK